MSGTNAIPVLFASCPKCKFENTPRGKTHVLAMVCTSCNTYFTLGKWSDEEVTFLESHEPIIPVGQKGKIKGVTYEVSGFVIKRDKRYGSRWREYFLFNPKEGIAFLSEYNGHWNFIKPISGNPKGDSVNDSFQFDNHEYRLFQKYNADIIYAKGEFFFDIFKLADRTLNYEYIAPPYLLGLEWSTSSLLWYKGEYISREEVATAFGVTSYSLPSQEGIGATQPVIKAGFSDSALASVFGMLAGMVILLQVLFSNIAANRQVIDQSFNKSDLPKEGEKLYVTRSFQLESTGSLEVKIKAPVDNDWFYADLVLVNEDTGEEYNFSKEVGYYHGYEDGSSWSEGNTVGEAFLSQIPHGNYHVVIYPEFSSSETFDFWIVQDVSMPSNMFLTLLGLVVFPVGFFIYKYNREKSRWSESDYSPYYTE